MCPYCRNSSPFDENKYYEFNKLETKLEGTIECNDCGFLFSKKDLWNPSSGPIYGNYTRRSCPRCGNPNIFIKCFICEEIARGFDAYQDEFTCDRHLSQRCTICEEMVMGKNIISKLGGGHTTYYYHDSCFAKKKNQEKWKAFPFGVIIQPILIGIVAGVTIGLMGGGLAALFLRKYIKIGTSSFLAIGFILVFVYVYIGKLLENIKEFKKHGRII